MNGTDPRITITDINIPFGRLVLFFIKAGLAAIPAAIVVSLIFAIIMTAIGALFGWTGHWRGMWITT